MRARAGSDLDEQIRDHARTKAFHPRTLQRWLDWDEPDKATLFRFATGLKIGENHLRDLMDWLEEIALRDQVRIHEICRRRAVTAIETDPRLGRGDKLKRIKEELRRLRFPRLAQLEDAISARIRELKLHPQVKISLAPGLESGRLHVEFSALTRDELKSAVGKLSQAAETEAMREVFALLSGEEVKRRA